MRESKSLTFLGQPGMNRKMKKLSRQGWRVVSTTPNVLGGIVATLERESPAPMSRNPSEPAAIASSPNGHSVCQHSAIHTIVTPTIKHTQVCSVCDSVVSVAAFSAPTDVDPESLRTLREWIHTRPDGDVLGRFIADSISTV